MKYADYVKVGSRYSVENLPESMASHRGLKEGESVLVSAVGNNWCDVRAGCGRTFRLFSGRLRPRLGSR